QPVHRPRRGAKGQAESVSLLFRRRERRSWPPPTDSLAELYRRRESSLDAGVHVDSTTAARHGAVFACVDLIARLVSTLPLREYRRVGGVFQEMPAQPRVLMTPDGELDVCDFNYQVLDSALKTGNAFALIERYDSDQYPSLVRTLPHGTV